MTWKWRKACGLKKKEYNLLKTVSLKMKHLTANEWFKTGLSHISWFFDLALSLSVSLGFLDSSGQYSPSSFKGEKKNVMWIPREGMQSQHWNDDSGWKKHELDRRGTGAPLRLPPQPDTVSLLDTTWASPVCAGCSHPIFRWSGDQLD